MRQIFLKIVCDICDYDLVIDNKFHCPSENLLGVKIKCHKITKLDYHGTKIRLELELDVLLFATKTEM